MNTRSILYRPYVSILFCSTLIFSHSLSAVPGMQWLFFMLPKAVNVAPKVVEVVLTYGKQLVITVPNAVKFTVSCAGLAGAGALLKEGSSTPSTGPAVKPSGLEKLASHSAVQSSSTLSKLQTPSSSSNND